ncbi:RNA polymerase sigma-70 factor (ECF subfamily) [Saccharothrix saharensis]|uniref:RNA polymerase sigma-70 factor (ECF subfamily) n=1 Tax=Saccharothrix saharensis TaxID=571190 RepID=A0A543JP32_9PSEU|nr:sigma-70 family RNA polymerase sigma factor [Saccharothrix saharensis]TQM84627.1 RNA polymerase sigma-70 factor (ECF subfamily) [Saccharothrix saharensis]
MALLRSLHDEHAPALWRYVRRLTGDDELSRDVVQEALLRAWRNPKVLEQGAAAARAWLYTVARNVVIDERRSARARWEVGSERLPERARSDHSDAALDAWLVADVLTQLTPEHRAVIVRAYYMGQSVAELAVALDLPEGTVKSRLHYGLRALRLALEEKGVTGR